LPSGTFSQRSNRQSHDGDGGLRRRVLGKVLVQEGSKVPIGNRIAMLLAEGEKAPAEGAEAPSSPAAKPAPAAEIAATSPSRKGDSAAPAPQDNGAPLALGRIKPRPLARKLAKEKGVGYQLAEWHRPRRTNRCKGHCRRTTAQSCTRRPQHTTASSAPAVASMPAGEGDQRIPLSGMRRVIASASWRARLSCHISTSSSK
jgi:pyruvate dehydrogenase E2 component (dihydrolipoamide acetyltransferase)